MNLKKYKLLPLVLIALLGLAALPMRPAFAPPAQAIYVSPALVDATALGLGLGDSFDVFVHVNITDPAGLFGYEFKLQWDNVLLNHVSHAFNHPWTPNFVASDALTPGQLYVGVSALSPATPFIGDTYLLQVTFQIVYQPVQPDPDITSPIHLADTKLGRQDATSIPHTPYDATYFIAAAPISKPSLRLTPDFFRSNTEFELFDIDLEITGLLPQWELYGWEAKLYFDDSVLGVAAVTNGSFFEAFKTGPPNGTFFLYSIYPGYIHMAGLFLGARTPPAGSGVLATVTFDSTTLPASPAIETSDLILSDIKLGAIDLSLIPLQSVSGGYYEGYLVTGRNIDVVTETERWPGYTTDVIGEGPGAVADAYSPQENVTVCAYLTYNEAPIASKAVAFEVHSPFDDIVFTRQTTTNIDGRACITFRIPWPDVDPESIVFGEWSVLAKASVAEMSVNDTVFFQVGWIVSGVITVISPDPVSRGNTVTINFDATNIGFIPRNVFASVVVYDELGVPVGSGNAYITVDPGTHSYSLTVDIASYAYVGLATAYLNLFTGYLPSECGVCYGPETTETFGIVWP